jgi:hypothetical protein
MSFADWLPKSHRFQLLAVAVLSTGITAVAILGTQSIRRQIRIERLKQSISDGEKEHDVSAFRLGSRT